MREILFRGKNKDGEWVEGFLFKYKGKYCVAEGSIMGDDYGLYSTCYDKVIPETIGQYTGLTDKNGKKIFEGDIIKQTLPAGKYERDIISTIEYGIEYAYSNVYGVCQRFRDGSGKSLLSVFDKSGTVHCEVIGNIHDNPELLKGGV